MSDEELDRNEEASPHKLERARDKGQIARSSEVVSAAVFAAAVITAAALGWEGLRNVIRFDRLVLQQGLDAWHDPEAVWQLVKDCLHGGLNFMTPLLISILIAAIAGNVFQTGLNFTLHPLTPDLQRINPVGGLKRLFTLRTLFDAGRAIAKLTVLTWVAYSALVAFIPQFRKVAALPPIAQLRILVDDATSLSMKMLLALVVISIIDLAYSKSEFGRKMRMSRRELKDEAKHREGDPRIRQRLRELRREMLQRALSLRKTRDADVVLTNPTHVAVALRYRHGEMAAPVVLSKGKGALASVVRTIAVRHNIPIIEHPALARSLYAQSQLDQQIPPALFGQVARIMVWVMAMRRARNATVG